MNRLPHTRLDPARRRSLLRGAALALLVGLAIWAPAEQNDNHDAEPASAGQTAEQDTGNVNIPFKTLGGKQLWADELIYSNWRIQRHSITGHCRLLDPENIRRAWGTYLECEASLSQRREAGDIDPPSTNTVILLHGIWRAKESMRPLETALRDAGYETVSINYPSTQDTIEDHAARLARIIDRLEGAERISFVTHSMGGLVVRRYLQDHHDPRIARLVMIAPPNKGAQMATWLDKAKVLRLTFGPAGPEMRNDSRGILDQLAVPWCEFGVIAGGKSDGQGYNPFLDEDNDLTVEVENTKLEGMADFLVVPALHSFIMNRTETIGAVINFMAAGRFAPE